MQKKKKYKGLIFVISGPSGSGKTTLRKKLLQKKGLRKRFSNSISFTTRPKRSAERQGKDYFFISPEEFLKQQRAKKILEWTKYLGYYYATPRDFVEGELKKGKHLILCLDIKGALRIKRFYPKNTVLIFILPPSLKALQNRIKGRCNKTKKEEIRERLKLAKEELLASRHYEHSIINRKLPDAVRRLKEIVLKERQNIKA